MKLSCSAYQAGSSYGKKIFSGQTQNYGATSTTVNLSGDSTQGINLPSWKVEEVEGKSSPNETPPDYGNESYQASGGGTPSSSSTAAAAAAGSSRGADGGAGSSSKGHDSRRASSSSHHSQQSDGQSDRHHSDSTSVSKAQATSSGSPTDSPATRLSELSRSRSKSVGEQQWTNLRAVLAWYARLRRIKRSKSNQRWMKLRTTVQLTGAIQTIQKKAPLKREDSFLKRFSTRQIPEAQDTFEVAEDDGPIGADGERTKITRKKKRSLPRSVVNPDGNFYFYWLMILTFCVLYNLWTLIVRQSFPELQSEARVFWIMADSFSDLVFLLDIAVQFRTGYLEQGLMVYKTKKLAKHYIGSKPFYFDLCSLLPTDLFQLYYGTNPMFRFPRFLKIYRTYNYYYMVESRTVFPNVWRVVNLIHILLLLAHWFGCFYFLLSEAEHFKGPWVYPDPKHPNNTDFAPLTRKYLGSLYWSTLTLTTIGDLPTPYSNWQLGDRSTPFNPTETGGFRTQAHKSRLLYIRSDIGYLFTIISYLIGVFIFATIVGQVGNVITNRNANRLEFERLLDGAKTYMRHHKVPRDMQRRVLRWYDYSWSRGRIQGGGDINTALGLLPDKLKTELALHVNLSVLKKVTIFQECQPEFLHDLVLKMKAYIFTPGDLICRKGEVAREMFIIADGILEVISETGRVLTTMQAGDFFGEIGILNLDGLNKRTADVRSVGYSELFSLSREDVLAAMKDYPEAQEILQTLGRKRLMEARKASGAVNPKKSSSDREKKTQVLSLATKENPDAVVGDSTAGKRIVEKLQSDFKGLKDVIRRSRKSNSSRDDSSEPESGKADGEGGTMDAKSFPPPRGVLKRMHNVVLSDEKDKEPSTSTSTSTSSPSILSKRGGGKRVQLSSLLRKDLQSQPKEPEVIGEGLPLIQRLRLLKQKEERERKQQEEREAMMQSLITKTPQSPSTSLASSVVRTKVSVEVPPSTSSMEGKEVVKPVTSAPPKEPDKPRESVSSMDSASSVSSPQSSSLALRALSPPLKSGTLLGEAAAIAISKATSELPVTTTAATPSVPPKLTSQISFSPTTTTSGSMSPPVLDTSSIGRDRSASASSAPAGTTVEPLSMMRPAALHFRQKTYGSVDDLSPEFSRLPFVKKLKILNERQKIAALLVSKKTSNVLTRSTSEGSNEATAVAGSVPSEADIQDQLHALSMGRRTQSNQEQLQGQGSSGDDSSSIMVPGQIQVPSMTMFDQSPPEREVRKSRNRWPMMLAKSDTVIQVHPTSAENVVHDSNATKCLIKLETDEASSTLSTISSKIPSRLSPSPTTAHGSIKKKKKSKKVHMTSPTADKREEGTTSSSSTTSTPSPPELDSSETPERRNLKSILKRLAKSEEATEAELKRVGESSAAAGGTHVTKKIEERRLLKAPTIEGYAARHRKFAKNVTFHRQAVTVVSPEDLAAGALKPGKDSLRIAEGLKVVKPETEICESFADFGPETGIATQTEQVISVSEHSIVPDNMKSFTNLMVVKGEDLAFSGDRHPGTLQIGLNIAQEECIGSVFMGIKAIIQSKVDEIHSRFQDNFSTLEQEVRKRDEIIFRLQRRIQELERISDRRRSRNGNGLRGDDSHLDFGGNDGDNEMDDVDGDIDDDEELLLGSEASFQPRYPLEFQTSYLFSRGDSIDTVISAQDYDDDVFERSEQASREASRSLSQPAGDPTRSSQHYHQQQRRRSRDMGNGDGQKSSPTWAQISQEETIEMREFGNAPWQVEFHRDRDSLPPPNEKSFGTRNIDKDSVAVDIGNTSTEYESSGSSGSEEGKPKSVCHRRLKEEPVALDDEDEEGEQTDDGTEEEDSDESSADEPRLTNKNWEVHMLAKEMDKIEKTRPDNTEMLGEAEYLQNEIKQMRDAVTSGELSPSELDMLESILESKSRRVKAIVKALSVETAFPASAGGKATTSAVSVRDTPRARPLGTNQLQSLAASELPTSSVYSHQPRLSLGILPPIPSSSVQAAMSSGTSERLSPGERRELHKLVFSRKRSTTVRRQASLCETSLTEAVATSTTKDSQRRRESAGGFPVSVDAQDSSTKSFFSKLSLVRQLTSRGYGSKPPAVYKGPSSMSVDQPTTTESSASGPSSTLATESVVQTFGSSSGSSTIIAGTASLTTTASETGEGTVTQSQHKSSSIAILPSVSSTATSAPASSVATSDANLDQGDGHSTTTVRSTAMAVSSSDKPTSTTAVTSESAIYTIPSTSVPTQPSSSKSVTTRATSSELGGESQPLLKK